MTVNKDKTIAACLSVLVHLIFFVLFKIYKKDIIIVKNVIEIDTIILLKTAKVASDNSINKIENIKKESDKHHNVKEKDKIKPILKNTSPALATESICEVNPVEDFFEKNTDNQLDDEKMNDLDKIDQRSIYKIDDENNESPSVQLDIDGWDWTTIPSPNDDTQETGYIIFQITIDEYGYVMGIKTLKKNISSRVESIYREALEKVSFTKKQSNKNFNNTTTGTVTFYIASY